MEYTEYVLVPFPDVQKFMEKEWFETEAFIVVSDEITGYFIPKIRVYENSTSGKKTR